jgi:glycoside/pentoside/hexuronide:cation symporter, GPH family
VIGRDQRWGAGVRTFTAGHFFQVYYLQRYGGFQGPYAALAIEVTTDESERLQVMAARTAMANLSCILIGWLYWLCQRSFFSDPVQGMRCVGIVFGVVLALCALVPAWIARGNPVHVGIEHAPPIKFDKKFALQILGIKSFRLLLVSLLSLLVGFTIVGHLGFYLSVYYICQGDKALSAWLGGINATLGPIFSMAACPFVAAVAKRIGKRYALALFLGVGSLGSVSYWWTMTPLHPYLFIFSGLGLYLGLAAYWSIMPTYLGEISDAFELETGLACQGIFSALYGIAVKIGVSLSLLLTGYILIICKFNVTQTSEQMVVPLIHMKILYAVIPMLGMMLALRVLWNIKITELRRSA